MSDHNFEKQVKLKMDEWHLRPSEGIWAGVEKKIRQRRRRRAAALWLSTFLLFLVAGGSYYSFHHSQPVTNFAQTRHTTTPAAGASETTIKPALIPIVKDSIHQNTTTSDNNSTLHSIVVERETSATKPKNTGADKPVSSDNDKALTGTEVHHTTKTPIATSGSKTTHSSSRNKKGNSHKEFTDKSNLQRRTIINRRSNKNRESIAANKPVSDNDGLAEKQNLNSDNSASNFTGVTGGGAAVKEEKGEPLYTYPRTDWQAVSRGEFNLDSIDVPLEKVQPAKKQSSYSHWRFGVKADAGYSTVKQGKLVTLFKSNDPQNSIQQSNVVNIGYSAARVTGEPSEITKSIYYSFGFFAERWFTSRLAVTSGVQYDYFSTKIETGQYVDRAMVVTNGSLLNQSVVRGYYLNSSSQTYVNKYQYITIPLSVQYKINAGRKLPMYVNGGATFTRLLSTTMLHFDEKTKVYYENDELVNKNQIGVQAGFDVEFLQHSRFPLRAGPTVRYNFTGVVNSPDVNADKNLHLWSMGISLKMLIKK